MSGWWGSRKMANDPLRFPPPWSTYRAVSLKTRNIGANPFETPFVPSILDPVPRMLDTDRPIPPAPFEIRAHRFRVSKMPSIESSTIVIKKQDANCCLARPAWNKVGVAWVYCKRDVASYVWRTIPRLSPCNATATRNNMYWGLSMIMPCFFRR